VTSRTKTGIYVLTPATKHSYGRLRTWLTEHGIEPNLVPTNARVVVGAGRVTIDVFLTRDGLTYRTNGDGSALARGTITVPLVEHLELPRCLAPTSTPKRDLLPTGGIRT
jgi:hypothetical protein